MRSTDLVFTIVGATLLAMGNTLQMTNLLQKQRAELQWRNEATNKFTWKATQELKWTVTNAFTDVQTSPSGDIYAVQHLTPEGGDEKYYLYTYTVENSTWALWKSGKQAKGARFDLLGNMYYLNTANCIIRDKDEA
jgi:hypothetical protein